MRAFRPTLFLRVIPLVPLLLGACAETGLEPRSEEPLPAPVYAALSVGNNHACALDTDGRAFCWGGNEYGQLGIGSTERSDAPMPVAGGHRFMAIDAGFWRTCGITTEGAMLCWGYTGTVASRLLPIRLGPADVEFVALDVADLACALTAEGVVYCGRTPPDFTPEFPGRTWRSVSIAALHGCLVSEDGEGYCWGYNNSRQLGIDALGYYEDPVPAPGGETWLELRAGNEYTCGTTTSGVTSCWGLALDAALGTDTIPEDQAWRGIAEPIPLVGGDLPVHDLVAAEDRGSIFDRHVTCGRAALGGRAIIVCWGDGRLPLNLGFGRTEWQDIGIGENDACGLRADGRIDCWSGSPATDWDLISPDFVPTELPAPAVEWRDG